VPEDRLTPAVSWSAKSRDMRWHRVRDEVAPWWRGGVDARLPSGIVGDGRAAGLTNWSDWRPGNAKAESRVPQVQEAGPNVPSVSFVEINISSRGCTRTATTPGSCCQQSTPDPQVAPTAGSARLAAHHRVHRAALPPRRVGGRHHPEGDHRPAGRTLAGVVPAPLQDGPHNPAGQAPGWPRRRRRRGETPAHHGPSQYPVSPTPMANVANPRVLDAHLKRLRRVRLGPCPGAAGFEEPPQNWSGAGHSSTAG